MSSYRRLPTRELSSPATSAPLTDGRRLFHVKLPSQRTGIPIDRERAPWVRCVDRCGHTASNRPPRPPVSLGEAHHCLGGSYHGVPAFLVQGGV